MTENNQPTGIPAADPHIVRQLTQALSATFQTFVDQYDGNVAFVDAFMAAHNFHVFIVEHLVEATGNDIWRNGAVATLEKRMENPGEYDTKTGAK